MLSKKNEYEKYQNIKSLLEDPIYLQSFKNFDAAAMPMQWKLFYGFAKKKSALGVYFLASVIQQIQKSKNS
ncbi:hypothetical protein D3C72_2092460 [compost metagenome]